MLAQEVVPIQVTDPLTLIISVSAVVVALLSLVWTVVQGTQIRRIERREHEWQVEARKSAWIQVNNKVVPQDIDLGDGRVGTTYHRYLTLTNTGLATAKNLEWSVGPDGPTILQSGMPFLHPGESFDLMYMADITVPPGWRFVVVWQDGHDEKRYSERVIEPRD